MNYETTLDALAVALEGDGYDVVKRSWECVDGSVDLVVTNGVEAVFVDIYELGRVSGERSQGANLISADHERIEAMAGRFFFRHPDEARVRYCRLEHCESDGVSVYRFHENVLVIKAEREVTA